MDAQITLEKDLILKDSWTSLIQLFIANLDRKETTKNCYRNSLKQWVLFLQTTNRKPDTNLILQYKNYLIDKKLSAYAVSLYLSALKAFFDFLVERQIIPFNPAKSVRGVKKPKSKRDSLTKDEALRLLSLDFGNSVEDLRNKAILLLKLFTGLRDISIVKADLSDLRAKEGKHVLSYQGKGRDSKDDFVILEESVFNAITDYLAKMNNKDSQAPLFASLSDRNKNKRLTTQSIRLIIRSFFNKANITRPEIQAHSLRHSSISFSLLGGAKIEQAQEMAGHADIQTTANYFHDSKRLQDPAEFYIKKFLVS